jgi:hypothetical protein
MSIYGDMFALSSRMLGINWATPAVQLEKLIRPGAIPIGADQMAGWLSLFLPFHLPGLQNAKILQPLSGVCIRV